MKKIGRPKQEVTKEKISVTLSPETLKLLTELGQGNTSAGIEKVFSEFKRQLSKGTIKDAVLYDPNDLFS